MSYGYHRRPTTGRRPYRPRRARYARRRLRSSRARPSRVRTMGRMQVARGLRPAVHYYKRTVEYTMDMCDTIGQPSVPPGMLNTADRGVVWNFVLSLSSFPTFAPAIQGLYHEWKINGLALKIIPNCTASSTGTERIIIRTRRERSGQALTTANTRQDWVNNQATKQFAIPNGGDRPFSSYTRANQLGHRYASTLNTDYGTMKPTWISTAEPDTSHYGNVFRFDSASSNALVGGAPASFPEMTIRVTAYFACRQVK